MTPFMGKCAIPLKRKFTLKCFVFTPWDLFCHTASTCVFCLLLIPPPVWTVNQSRGHYHRLPAPSDLSISIREGKRVVSDPLH